MNSRVGCAILAAGASRRLGHPKQLLLHRGQPLVQLAAECATRSRAAACVVVVGAEAAAVSAALVGIPVKIVNNEGWVEGVASSIRAACAWAERAECDALLIALCDQPRLTAEHLDRLIDEHERAGSRVASHYAGKNAVPALFPKAYFDALASLRGDSGASALLNGSRGVSEVPWEDGALDVDTAAEARDL